MGASYTNSYSSNIDYLVSSILYLGSHTYYWARTPSGMSSELTLDELRLQQVFDGFPGLFRKSKTRSKNGQPYYSLQARYALREGGDTSEPDKVSYIKPLETDRMELLINFVLQMAEHEKSDARNSATNWVAVIAAVVSALAALGAVFLTL